MKPQADLLEKLAKLTKFIYTEQEKRHKFLKSKMKNSVSLQILQKLKCI